MPLNAVPKTIEQGGKVRLTYELPRIGLGMIASGSPASAPGGGAPSTPPTAPSASASTSPPGGTAAPAAVGPVAAPAATITWEIVGIGTIAATPVLAGASGPWNVDWDVPANLQPSQYTARAVYTESGSAPIDEADTFVVTSRPLGPTDPFHVQVRMRRTGTDPTDDQALWSAIRLSTDGLAFKPYAEWIEPIMCSGQLPGPRVPAPRRDPLNPAMAFPGVDPYLLLRVATEVFLLARCGVHIQSNNIQQLFAGLDLADEARRYATEQPDPQAFQRAIELQWQRYVGAAPGHPNPATDPAALPYLAVIREKLGGVGFPLQDGFGRDCSGILREKLAFPCFLELFWSFWHELGNLTHSVDAIALRFQNIRGPGARDPLAHVEIDPLRALNPILWGYVQDKEHRLTALRRAHEYDHHYGISQLPPGAPSLRPADSRPQFLEAFHTLLHLASAFFRDDDDTTVIADGFPVLNALRDVHLLLTEGQHNQYGDLPWTARQEMLMQQWILARPEMREFLPGRTMVAYPEAWMDRVDTMKRLQGWGSDSVIHFHNLGRFGEQLLLSVRFGNWGAVIDRDSAANWARYWRTEIQGYVHSYRSVTGADLTEAPVDTALPTLHLVRRLSPQGPGRAALPPTTRGTASPALRRRAAPRLAQPRPVPQLPPAQRPPAASPAPLPPGSQGAPRLPRREGR
ncbi:hypothetical protein [Streptomyces sp. NBC_01092]|uniref:hypothetical protein n=1 Tax=Streptomyces sp. NBC_01092 TaxID=2903748 RepID=UPI00386AF1E1|nr:hypothetical protein OG254_09100 [Streptomyces sp. NBC_01092]